MIYAGIDMGAKNIKMVLLRKDDILYKGLEPGGFDSKTALSGLMEEALARTGISRCDIEKISATGVGRNEVDIADEKVNEVTAAARGAVYFFRAARTVIDVGAEEGRGIRCDENGKVVDFEINEKCAAGAGSFTEAMARALEIPVEEMGALSLRSTKEIPMNAQCVVFAESEVVSLVHAKTPKEDIIKAVHDAIASRISLMVRKVGLEPDIVLIGGLGRNVGFVDSLKKNLESDIRIPREPEFVGAVGAALVASKAPQKELSGGSPK